MGSELKIALLFPGQGSQYPSMLKRLPEHPAIQDTLVEASDALRENIFEIDTEQALQKSRNVQLSVFISGVATARALASEGVLPSAAAGLSIGAYAAAVAVSSLSFVDGLKIVRTRGELVDQQFSSGYAMSAVVGLNERRVTQLIDKIAAQGHEVYLANINSPTQMVVSGADRDLTAMEELCQRSGARKVERLPITVPSHCRLLEHVAAQLESSFRTVKLVAPSAPYISNIRARALRDANLVADDLARNISHTVRWCDSVCILQELGMNTFIELSPGNVLTRLNAEILPDLRSYSIDENGFEFVLERVKSSLSS